MLVLCLTGLLSIPSSSMALGQAEGAWTVLLDETLKGWNVVGDANWTVADGAVQADKGAAFRTMSAPFTNARRLSAPPGPRFEQGQDLPFSRDGLLLWACSCSLDGGTSSALLGEHVLQAFENCENRVSVKVPERLHEALHINRPKLIKRHEA